MKIDFNKKFTNFNGEILKDSQSQKELSLKDVCVEALMVVDQKEEIDGEEKVKRYNLALDIYNGKKENLSSEEIVLLKELIGRYFSTIVVGQALKMLEND
jgi:hypothetical protein